MVIRSIADMLARVDLSAIFKAYDVRGIYPDQFDEVISHRIGAAFASFTGAARVTVGRDMRNSSEPLARAFVEGATGAGADVVDVGMVSTDALYFASGKYDLPGAMFTASHNPAEWNGIKFCRAGAAPIGEETGLVQIRKLAERGVDPAGRPGMSATREVLDDFAAHVLGFVDTRRLRPLKVVVDAANGMGGVVIPRVFERLPVDLVPLFFDLDGTFPNHPADPIQIENLADLRRTVLKTGADLGMAFDGDADRVFLVDEKAEPVSGSLTTALVARRVLSKEPGSAIVHSVICSRVVRETIGSMGGHAIPSRVGHSFMKQVMASSGAAFGGEHSGHYYFRDNYRADSGLICAVFVLEAMSVEGKPMSEILDPLRRYWNSGEINSDVVDQKAKIAEITQAYSSGEQDMTDGVTVSYPDWWFNVRPSNTEPKLRLNVEASDPELGRAKTDELLMLIRGTGG